MTECFYHVTLYAFYSQPALSSCLNVKELLAQKGWDIWGLSDCNGIGTHSPVGNRALNHWPVWLNGSVFVYQLSSCGFESRCSHIVYHCMLVIKKNMLVLGERPTNVLPDATMMAEGKYSVNITNFIKKICLIC